MREWTFLLPLTVKVKVVQQRGGASVLAEDVEHRRGGSSDHVRVFDRLESLLLRDEHVHTCSARVLEVYTRYVWTRKWWRGSSKHTSSEGGGGGGGSSFTTVGMIG